MALIEHETYAKELLTSLADDHAELANLDFSPEPRKTRNAANAMTAIICGRLSRDPTHRPTHITQTTYSWKTGIFNCRNIADRDHFWTNMRRRVADRMHEFATNRPVAYVMSVSDPTDTMLNVWAIPEPTLHDSLLHLPEKPIGQEYTIQISTSKQRIEHYGESPDLSPFYRKLVLSPEELSVLNASRETDALAKQDRASARGKEETETEDVDDSAAVVTETDLHLAAAGQQLTDAGVFEPSGVTDARERVLSAIVRRRGQPAFRRQLLTAFGGQCAISGCSLEAVLEAAHILPYMGPETNHIGNGLLLRADLHTLFDLSLIAVDAATMDVLISPVLAGTCYEEYRGKPIRLPSNPSDGPSTQALDRHRQTSGL